MSQQPGRSAVPPTALLAMMALLVSLLAALSPGTTAHAAGSVKLTIPGTPVAGTKTKLVATVKPKTKGRTVVFQVKNGKKWTKLGKAKTNTSGKATTHTKKLKPGKQTLRVVAQKHKRHKKQSSTKKITVKTKNPGNNTIPKDTGNRLGDHHQIIAPERVTTGSTFEMTIEVNAKRAFTNARLVITAPTKGTQITTPADVPLVGGKATVTLGDLPAKEPRTVTLRWKAPTTRTTLEIKARLTATGGFTDATDANILVEEPGGSASMPACDLHIFLTTQELPEDPEKLKAPCIARDRHGPVTFKDALTQAKDWVKTQQISGQGDWTKAVSTTQQALAHEPENPLIHRQLASLMVCVGRKSEALGHLHQGYREDPDIPDGVHADPAQGARLAG